jgi:hypothetical protein
VAAGRFAHACDECMCTNLIKGMCTRRQASYYYLRLVGGGWLEDRLGLGTSDPRACRYRMCIELMMILPVCDAVAVEQAAKPAGSTRASWPTSERSRRLGAETAGRTSQRPMQAQSRVGVWGWGEGGAHAPAPRAPLPYVVVWAS